MFMTNMTDQHYCCLNFPVFFLYIKNFNLYEVVINLFIILFQVYNVPTPIPLPMPTFPTNDPNFPQVAQPASRACTFPLHSCPTVLLFNLPLPPSPIEWSSFLLSPGLCNSFTKLSHERVSFYWHMRETILCLSLPLWIISLNSRIIYIEPNCIT